MKTTYEIKLQELENGFKSMTDTLLTYEWLNLEQKDMLVLDMIKSYEERQEILVDQIKQSKSQAVRQLADAQKTYFETIKNLMEKEIPSCLHCSETSVEEDRREANALMAEYAIDFAEQSFRYAVIAVLNDEKLSN